MELEKKYLEKYKPLYKRRADIVNGITEPKDDEMEAGLAAEQEDTETVVDTTTKEEEETPATDAPKGVPEFWLTAMKNMIALADLITSKDEEVLRHLTDVRLSYLDVPGFRLEFEFAANDFFTDKVLTKSYFYQQQAGYGGDFIYDHAEGMTISWNEGKDLTMKIETKRQRNKSTLPAFISSHLTLQTQTKRGLSSELSLSIVSSTFSIPPFLAKTMLRRKRNKTTISTKGLNWITISAKTSRRS